MFRDCNYPKFINFLLSLNAGLFLYLFGKFYYVNYIKPNIKIAQNGSIRKEVIVNNNIKINEAINEEIQKDADRETEISSGKTKTC